MELLAIVPNSEAQRGERLVAALVLCVAGLLLLSARRTRISGTTLTGAWWWAVGSLAAIVTGEIVLALLPTEARAAWASPLRFITATSTFCPGVYVLGARRPHAGAWHFVVLSMWGVLALPALESLFLGRGMALELGPIRGWFLWLAIGIVSLNYLPTRHWISAVLFAAGQTLLLSPWLPLVENGSGANADAMSRELVGITLIVAALAVAVLRPKRDTANLHPLDAAWLSFRDTFGGLWALRIFERVAFASRTYGWPMSLGWSRFTFHEPGQGWGDVNEKTLTEVQQTLDNLRRRFVDLRELEKLRKPTDEVSHFP